MGLRYCDRINVFARYEMEDDRHLHFWIFYTLVRHDCVLLENYHRCKVSTVSTVLILGAGHYLWRGVAPKRKGLGKQNFE